MSNEMFAIHDFLPTLASIVGAELPDDRPIDGIDQSDFLLGNQENSNREHLLTFIADRLMAVRWRQFRFYPLEVLASNSRPSLWSSLAYTEKRDRVANLAWGEYFSECF